jgi:hypothetical protein
MIDPSRIKVAHITSDVCPFNTSQVGCEGFVVPIILLQSEVGFSRQRRIVLSLLPERMVPSGSISTLFTALV